LGDVRLSIPRRSGDRDEELTRPEPATVAADPVDRDVEPRGERGRAGECRHQLGQPKRSLHSPPRHLLLPTAPRSKGPGNVSLGGVEIAPATRRVDVTSTPVIPDARGPAGLRS